MILELITLVIFTEAVTEIVTKSEIFSPIKEWFFNRRSKKAFNFIHNLLDCGYCFSVWASFFGLILLITENNFAYFFITGVVVHRLSNFFHFVLDRVRG